MQVFFGKSGNTAKFLNPALHPGLIKKKQL